MANEQKDRFVWILGKRKVNLSRVDELGIEQKEGRFEVYIVINGKYIRISTNLKSEEDAKDFIDNLITEA